MTHRKKMANIRFYLGGFIAAALLIPALTIAGDNDPSTSNVLAPNIIIPYDGHLALDNTPMNGQLNLRFELYDVDQGGAPVWTEDQANVSFYNGKFSVGLGSVTPLDAVVLDAEKVWLAIQIDDGSGTFFPLSGRQAITPTPYASWAANAADFDVAGALEVAGTSRFNGPAIANDVLTSNERLQINQSSNSTNMRMTRGATDWDFTIGNAGNLQLQNSDAKNFAVWTDGTFRVNDISSAAAFLVDTGANNAIEANRRLEANAGLVVNGDLTVNGEITNLNYTGPKTAEQTSTGTTTESLNVHEDDGMCFLTNVQLSNIDSTNEDARCWVRISAGNSTWQLTARVTNSSDASAKCEARCLTW